MKEQGSRPSWRLIVSPDCGAAENMALDEAIATRVRAGAAPPTLRLYGWDRPSVTLGCFQKSSDVDLAFCRSRDIPVVRRPTGGRAILHGRELTYSFSVRTDHAHFSKGLLDSYHSISRALCQGLLRVGVDAEMKAGREKGSTLSGSPLCFASSSYAELLVSGRKVVGSAQRRWPEGLLQQGSIPYAIDRRLLEGVFGEESSRAGSAITALEETVPGFDAQAFSSSVPACFEETFGITLREGAPAPEEDELARRLLESKYLQEGWNLRM